MTNRGIGGHLAEQIEATTLRITIRGDSPADLMMCSSVWMIFVPNKSCVLTESTKICLHCMVSGSCM